MFWKKVNRGLLLGGVLLVAFIVFLVVGEVRFKREIPEIQTVVEEFFEESIRLNLTGAEDELGGTRPEEEKRQKTEKMRELLNTYWKTDSSDLDLMLPAADEWESAFSSFLNQDIPVLVSDLDMTLQGNRMEVTREAPDRAAASVTFLIQPTYLGNVDSLFLTSDFVSKEYYDGDIGFYVESASVAENVYKETTIYFSVTVQLKRDGGEWKIVSAGGYRYW